MSIGLSFLTKIIDTQDMLGLNESGVNDTEFIEDELLVYEFITQYINKYGKTPDKKTVEVETAVRLPTIPNEPLSYWRDNLRHRSVGMRISEALARLSLAMNSGEYDDAERIVTELGAELVNSKQRLGKQLFTLSDLCEIIIKRHDDVQNMLLEQNVPYGFPYLDAVSNGMEKGDTIAIIGQKGVGKSYILAKMALSAYEAGVTPFFISMEMTAQQIGRRILALHARVPENEITRGNLSTFGGRQRAIGALLHFDADRPFYIMDGRFLFRIDELKNYVQAIRPDVVYVDGAYLLKPAKTRGNANRWDDMAEIAEQLKIFAGVAEVPIVGTYQMKKDKTMYGSKAVEQLASVVLSLTEEDKEDDDEEGWQGYSFKKIDIVKGRGGERGAIKLKYSLNMNVGITQHEVICNYLPPEEGHE